MGIKKIKDFKDLPFEVNKSYMTKFQTKEMFTIKEILLGKDGKQIGIKGIYENAKHLGICPLSIERLIPEKIEIGEIEICDKCLTKI